MNSVTGRLIKIFRASPATKSTSFVGLGVQRSSRFFSSGSLGSDDNEENDGHGLDVDDNDFIPDKPELRIQGVDPRKGWNFRGVHKAILCGKVGQAPVQKILRNGKTITIFTVGTGGMFDQRIWDAKDLPNPAQWHRVAVHNAALGAYSVQQLAKNSSVYVEGDIETRVYNDSINGEVKSIPEICVRRDGKIRLIRAGDSISSTSLEELRKFLLFENFASNVIPQYQVVLPFVVAAELEKRNVIYP